MTFSDTEKKRLFQRYGNWALITGASSGIGKELATRLAEAGFNLVITGRRASLLEELSRSLQNTYGGQIQPMQGDLSNMEEVDTLLQATNDLPIGLAILNAGFGTSGKFLQSNLDQELNMLQLNCSTLLAMSHHFARKFAEKGRGGLILMSSMVSFQGVPNAANYAATKAYVQTLGEALAVELKPQGVDVLCAAPGPVNSGFAARADMKMGAALSPEDVGVPILKALGRRTTALPGLLTKVLVYALRTAPRWGKIRIMSQVMGGFTKHQPST
ncbi:MAG: SDR family NAD(P)-dependent oxidoreductase [Bacteroidota bacterium]